MKEVNTPNTKILDNFEPYNDIWYKNCFYHALFPIVTHFNRNISPFLINDIFIYRYDKDKTGVKFTQEVLSKKSLLEILKSLGIIVNIKIASPNIINDLISSINNEKPVIIYIDCYYESIRPDAYQKNHFPHTLLIHGYNNIEEIFYILEHRYRDSLLYENRSISYSDLFNSYNGFLSNLHKDKTWPTYYEYDLLSESNVEKEYSKYYVNRDYIGEFSNYLYEKQGEIYKGMECIKRFSEDFKQIVLDESSLKSNIDELLNTLNNIINNKNLERYRTLKIFDFKLEFINYIDSIISNWSFIRGIIAKYKFSSVYNLKSFEHSVDKIKEIYDLENYWYDNLLSFIHAKKGGVK